MDFVEILDAFVDAMWLQKIIDFSEEPHRFQRESNENHLFVKGKITDLSENLKKIISF